MGKKKTRKEQVDNFYEGVAKVADFVNDRLGNVQAPTGLNNTVEEYMDGDKGRE